MKKFVYTLLALTIGLTSCSKWTETESNAEDFERAALEDLKNKRDAAKWLAEAERTEENKKALEAYWAQLREYKQKAWANQGEKPFIYMWWTGWRAVDGLDRSWLQSIPDTTTAISLWGGYGKQPADMTENERNEIARIVGMGALKYFILKVDARKNMLFNPEESIDFNGNTGPFIQYTYARIRSIMRKAEAEGIVLPSVLPDTLPLNEKEVQLIQKLNSFETVVEQAGKDYSPSGIANYCYELTKDFNQFYHDYSILNAESAEAKTLRLALAKNVAKTIKNGMQLLGIEVPERM